MWTSPDDYARALEGLRGRIVQQGHVDGMPAAQVELRGDDVATGWEAAKLLVRLAEQDAEKPDVVALALDARRHVAACGGDELDLATFLHAFVKDRVAFVRETGERFQSTMYTLETGAGDCDDSARALYALARAAGLRAKMAFLVQDDQPAHVFAVLGCNGHWVPAETTIDAELGENPTDAAVRLGVPFRADLARAPMVTIGALGPSLIVATGTEQANYSWKIRSGDRVRLVCEVSMLSRPEDAVAGFEAIGFTGVSATTERAQLDLLQWPSSWLDETGTSPATLGRQLMYVEGVYAGDAPALNRTLDFAYIRDARKVLMEGDGSDQATSQAGAPAAPSAQPLTAATVGPLLPDPADHDKSTPRSPWLASVLRHAWYEAFGSDAAYPYNASLEQGILAVCDLETDMGRSNWDDPIDAHGYSLRWNFGNVHSGMNPTAGVCPTGSKPHGDTRWDASQGKYVPYTTCFQAYKSAVEGMKAMVKIIAGSGREDTRKALLSGDSTAVAHAMAGHGYFDPHAEAQYANLLAANAKVIADHLSAPLAFAPGGAPSGGAAAGVIAGLLVLGAAGFGAWHALRHG